MTLPDPDFAVPIIEALEEYLRGRERIAFESQKSTASHRDLAVYKEDLKTWLTGMLEDAIDETVRKIVTEELDKRKG